MAFCHNIFLQKGTALLAKCSCLLTGKSPYFTGLEDQAALLEDPNSHLVDGQVMAAPPPPLSSPSRSSPHSQGSETGERFSRKVFVGGLPPDIDEGKAVCWGLVVLSFVSSY